MIAFNFFLTCICLWLILAINYRYLQPAVRNRKRFRLYRLRDELSLLAMRGEFDERSLEYRVLLYLINGAINAADTFKVTDFFRFLIGLRNADIQNKLDSVKRSLSTTRNNDYCRIAYESFAVIHEMFIADTRTLRYFVVPFVLPLLSVPAFFRIRKPKQAVEERKELIQKIGADIANNKTDFGSLCLS